MWSKVPIRHHVSSEYDNIYVRMYICERIHGGCGREDKLVMRNTTDRWIDRRIDGHTSF